MNKVRALMALGMSPTAAIKAALKSTDNGRTPLKLQDFAAKYNLKRPRVSNQIGGRAGATENIIDALRRELGGSPDEWKYLLWKAGEPDVERDVIESFEPAPARR